MALRPKTIKARLIGTFVIFGVVTIAINFIALVARLNKELTVQAETQFRDNSLFIYDKLEQQLSHSLDTVGVFSRSDFLVNSLIDPSERELYLTPLVSDLKKSRFIEAVYITDFEGEIVYPGNVQLPSFLERNVLRETLEIGSSARRIMRDDDRFKLIVIEPILYYATPQGASIVCIDLREVLRYVVPSNNQKHLHRAYYNGQRLMKPLPGQHIALYKSFRFNPPEQFAICHELGIQLESGILRSELSTLVRKLIPQLSIVNGIVVLIAVGLAYLLGRSFVRPIVRLADNVRKATPDTPTSCHPVGTGDELEDLALAFDKLSHQLVNANRSLEEKVKARTKRLARSNIELEQFAYTASHDLQEPVRTIGSYVNLLDKQYGDQLGQEAREYLSYCVDSAVRIRTLIGDVLQYSKIGIDQHPFEDVDLNDITKKVEQDLQKLIEDSHATIKIDALPFIQGLPTLLHQLFLNIMSNSLKYRKPDTPPVIEVAWRDEGDKVHITISDNGIGIEKQHIDKIFAIFQRLHTRDEYEGTGIGLAVCRRIMDRHHGSIWVESVFGEGSTFHFRLPRKHKDLPT